MAKTFFRGTARADAAFNLGLCAYNLIRLPKLSRWRERIFIALCRNAQSAVDYFHLPIPQLVEPGVQ